MGDEDVLKLPEVMIAQVCEYTKTMNYTLGVNRKVCTVYLNKVVAQNDTKCA